MSATAAVRIRPIALPAEHGSWGLVVEPIVLGLLVSPSLAGACLGLGAFATFLSRRPFKVVFADRQHAQSRRVAVARFFVLGYGATAFLGVAATFLLAGMGPLFPFLWGSPLIAVFLAYDIRNQSRSWQAELAGGVVFALVAAGVAIGGGWSAAPAYALTGVLVARAIPSILYVRNRIRLDRNRQHSRSLTLAAHVTALVGVAALARAALLPWLAVVPFVVLLGRALIGLSGYRRQIAVKTIGLTEAGYGVLTLAAVVAGYWTMA